MIHQTESESPQPVAEAESLVGVASTALFAVGDEVYHRADAEVKQNIQDK